MPFAKVFIHVHQPVRQSIRRSVRPIISFACECRNVSHPFCSDQSPINHGLSLLDYDRRLIAQCVEPLIGTPEIRLFAFLSAFDRAHLDGASLCLHVPSCVFLCALLYSSVYMSVFTSVFTSVSWHMPVMSTV